MTAPLPRHRHVLVPLLFVAALLVSWRGLRPAERATDPDPPLPIAFDGHFATSGTCNVCHGRDTSGVAMTSLAGQDVNVVDAWRGSMMGNASRDPFWRAKVAHEVAENPAHAAELQDLCTSCHAPLGHFSALAGGATHYGIADLVDDPMGLDGVSCGACHQQAAEGLGDRHSGQLRFDTAGRVFGPYGAPLGASMTAFFGGLLEPAFGSHILRAETCAGCHSLVTTTVDATGTPTGDRFVEQATWHEWENSAFPAEAVTCQQCHLPRIPDPVILSSLDDTLPGRTPFGKHELAGANTFMLSLMRDHADTLGLAASPAHLEAGRAAAERMLRRHTLAVTIRDAARDGDTLDLRVALDNRAGHKFPSGYPSRRAFVELLLLDQGGDTLFHGGAPRGQADPLGVDSPWEAHHAVVRAVDQVPVYEMVPVDDGGHATTVLERMARAVKDNRLPPRGFSATHPAWDTTAVVGRALDDPDFNGVDGSPESGGDVLRYRIGLDGYREAATVQARVWYQSVPRRWVRELFAVDDPAVDLFEGLYRSADGAPALVAGDTMALPPMPSAVAGPSAEGPWRAAPLPPVDGTLRILGTRPVARAWWYGADGRLLGAEAPAASGPRLTVPPVGGPWWLVLQGRDGTRQVIAVPGR